MAHFAVLIPVLGVILLPAVTAERYLPPGERFHCFECNSVFHKYCLNPFSNYVSTCETDGFCARISIGGAVTRKCLPQCIEGRIAEMTIACCRGTYCNTGTVTSPTTLSLLLLPLAVLWSQGLPSVSM